MTRSSEDDGFLGRWARRKEQTRRGERPEDQPDEVADPGDETAAADAAGDEQAPVLTDEDMPDIDSLRPDSDVSQFFSPGVSEALRRKALRRLFHTSRFNVKDGLDDYDDDYTLLQPLGNVVTSEMRRQEARLAERRRQREAEAAEARGEEPAAQRPGEDAVAEAGEQAGDAPVSGSPDTRLPADGPDDEDPGGDDPGRPA